MTLGLCDPVLENCLRMGLARYTPSNKQESHEILKPFFVIPTSKLQCSVWKYKNKNKNEFYT